MTPWWQRRMAAFDLETTCPLPEEARIVTASVALVGGGEPTEAHDWLADPGVDIPEEATAVHGVSTAQAREHGRPLAEVVAEVYERLRTAAEAGCAIVVFNARFDLTVLDRELRRLGLPLMPPVLVVDPMVIDTRLDRYRPSYMDERGKKLAMTPEEAMAAGHVSSRKLEGMCRIYAKRFAQRTGKPEPQLLVDAHNAAADALACARLAWLMGSAATAINYGRPSRDAEWEAARHDLVNLHDAQRRWALAERKRFADFLAERAEEKRRAGDEEGYAADAADAERVALEVDWPTLARMPHEPAELWTTEEAA